MRVHRYERSYIEKLGYLYCPILLFRKYINNFAHLHYLSLGRLLDILLGCCSLVLSIRCLDCLFDSDMARDNYMGLDL